MADAEVAPVEPTVEQADERRQLTVLSCRLVVTSTSGAALDPEDRREIIRRAQTVCRELIEQFGGHLAQTPSYGSAGLLWVSLCT